MKEPLRVRTQLLLLCAFFSGLLVIIGGIGMWESIRESQQIKTLYEDRVIPLKQLKAVSDMYAVNIVDTSHKFADGSMTGPVAIESLETAQRTIHNEWEAYTGTYLVPEEQALIGRLKPLMAAVDATLPPLRAMFEAGDRAGVDAFRKQTMYPTFDPMQAVIGDLILTQLKVSEQIHDNSVDDVQEIRWVLGGGTLAAILVGTLGLVWITSHLTHQLGAEPHEVRAVADAVAKGDLSMHIAVPKGYEKSVMASMGHMSETLSKLVAQVRANADSVRIASSEIAEGNQDLSQRSEQQASTIEETAASMLQIGATVKSSASHADRANQLAQSAAVAVTGSGEMMQELARTMQDIDAASTRITDIVSVIDGIAFQTNILALNAAVEAARAGEQGRGFAVVAGEVRSLAQRSADAAREVHQLIHGSHGAIEKGASLTVSAETSVQQSVAAIQDLSRLMHEITTTTREQNDGLTQIASAIGHLDQTTQQNAALVEESAAASASLRDQANFLVRAVSQFHLATT